MCQNPVPPQGRRTSCFCEGRCPFLHKDNPISTQAPLHHCARVPALLHGSHFCTSTVKEDRNEPYLIDMVHPFPLLLTQGSAANSLAALPCAKML